MDDHADDSTFSFDIFFLGRYELIVKEKSKKITSNEVLNQAVKQKMKKITENCERINHKACIIDIDREIKIVQ
ncbi:MAG: hypothetical protein MHPSP_000007 [Paramarteilia canceri]